MENNQSDKAHIRIDNSILEALIGIRIPGEAMQVLLLIIRKTVGWNKDSDYISLSQFVEATGLKKPNVIKARNKLLEMNLISVMQKDNDKDLKYCFNRKYKTWKPLPKKITLCKKITNVMQKDNLALCKKLPTKDTATTDTITTDIPPISPPEEEIKKCEKHGEYKSDTCKKCQREEDFENMFWPAYPPRKGRKNGKQAALKLFIKIPEKEIDNVLIGERNYAVYCRDTDTFPKDADTWLRNKLWKEWQQPYVQERKLTNNERAVLELRRKRESGEQ